MNALNVLVRPDADDAVAKRQALQAWTTDRATLLVEQPLLASLAMQLEICPVVDRRVLTAATDGERVYVNPWFLAELDGADRLFVLAHEVWHCALLHASRQGSREAEGWNVAADHEVNDLLYRAGFNLPRGLVHFPRFAGKAAESVYNLIDRPRRPHRLLDAHLGPNGVQGPGGGAGDGAAAWGLPVRNKCDPAFSPRPAPGQASRWRERLVQTAHRFGGTDLPAAMARIVAGLTQPTVSWQSILDRFIQRVGGGSASWSTPNRRHLHRRVWLPGRDRSTLRLAVAIDTSWSTHHHIDHFAVELRAIVNTYARFELRVLWFHTAVHHDDLLLPGQPMEKMVTGRFVGGGTNFIPLFERLAAAPPHGLVVLTDGAGPIPSAPPAYPVLWALVPSARRPRNWGEELCMPAPRERRRRRHWGVVRTWREM